MGEIVEFGCLFLVIGMFAIVAFAVVSALVWLGGWFLVAGVLAASIGLVVVASVVGETK